MPGGLIVKPPFYKALIKAFPGKSPGPELFSSATALERSRNDPHSNK